jgi:hypothetical protein
MKWVLAVVLFLLGCVGLVYLGYLQGQTVYVAGHDTGYEEGYKQGYKDALYKRPVSDELEIVCAGLWIGQETLKHQKRELRGGR